MIYGYVISSNEKPGGHEGRPGQSSINCCSESLMSSVTRGNIYRPWVCFTLLASNGEHICLPRGSQRINPSLKKDVNEIIISMFPRNLEIFFFVH